MKQIVKWIFIGLLVFVFLIVGLVFFVDANRMKPIVVKGVYNLTGANIVINGPLSWSAYPSLGVKSKDIILQGDISDRKKYTIRAANLVFNLRILPLIFGRIESGSLLINNASVDLQDDLKKYLIKNAYIKIANINQQKSFPLTANFDFVEQNMDFVAHINLNSELNLATPKKLIFAPLKIKAKIGKNNLSADIDLSSRLSFDLNNQMLIMENILGNIANVPIVGKLKLANIANNIFPTGSLQLKTFDLKELMTKVGANTDDLQKANIANGLIVFSSSNSQPRISGKLKLTNLRYSNLLFENILLPFQFVNNKFRVDSGQAKFYKGNIKTSFRANLANKPIRYAINLKLNSAQLQPMMLDIAKNTDLSVAGSLTASGDFITQGENINTILANLAGNMRFNIINGWVQGIDINYLLDFALKVVGRDVSPVWLGTTSFNNATGTAVIRNGIITNNDLKIISQRFDILGRGKVNLSKDNINYGLYINLNSKNSKNKAYLGDFLGVAIPVKISGPIKKPQIRLDHDELLNILATQKLQKIKQKTMKKIETKIQNKAHDLLNSFFNN